MYYSCEIVFFLSYTLVYNIYFIFLMFTVSGMRVAVHLSYIVLLQHLRVLDTIPIHSPKAQ